MNYSTIKKAVTCSMIAALGFTGAAQAQDDAKVFGGRSQFRTWTLGVNGGVTAPAVLVGGSTPFNKNVGFGEYTFREYYGLTLRKQFSHWFGLEGAINRGRIFAYNRGNDAGPIYTPRLDHLEQYTTSETTVQYAASINGVFHVGSIDFLREKNRVNFYASVGYGMMAFNPVNYTQYNDGNGTPIDNGGTYGPDGDRDYIRQTYIPVGVGAKIKLSERVALDLGYIMNFVDGKNLYGQVYNPANSFDRFSYTHAGLEFSLGSSSKPDLTYHNPVKDLYDELKDPELRNEVEALKQRVGALESTVEALSTDSDGDGVADKFDKCPNTPAGVQVDGAGCPIKFPEPEPASFSTGSYSRIQFEFDSSVLKTTSYPVLDQVAADLRSSGATITLEGNASIEGSESYNMQLSQDRANSVKNYLVNAGVAASQLNVVGNGVDKPVASNSTEEGRILNRNVQFVN